jgi:hypothetical protein
MNLLTARLKSAKRELTNLKTAHGRGLGLLKIYTRSVNLSAPTGEGAFFWLSIDVTFSVSPYPFAQKYIVTDTLDGNNFYVNDEFNYSNNGWGAEFRTGVAKQTAPSRVTVYSTSPITSISYSWSSLL